MNVRIRTGLVRAAVAAVAVAGVVGMAWGQSPLTGSNKLAGVDRTSGEIQVWYEVEPQNYMDAFYSYRAFSETYDVSEVSKPDEGNIGTVFVKSNEHSWDVIFKTANGGRLLRNGEDGSDPRHFLAWMGCGDTCIGQPMGLQIGILENGRTYVPTVVDSAKLVNSTDNGVAVSFADILSGNDDVQTSTPNDLASVLGGRDFVNSSNNGIKDKGFAATPETGIRFFINGGLGVTNKSEVIAANNIPAYYYETLKLQLIAND